MFPELKKDLESSIASSGPSYIDAAARRLKGKIFFRNRELHDFSCLDILGLSQNQRVKRSAQESIETLGFSNCGSRKNGGTSSSHIICEKSLANFFGYERSLLFSSKNQVVFSLLATLLREQDQVFCDTDSAGLLSDVCLLLNCPLEVVDLNDRANLEILFSAPAPARRRLVFSVSVSPSSSKKIDLLNLSLLCVRHNVLLINDESFAAGILGPRGAGVADECEFGFSPARPFCMISDLGLGLGAYGACLSGPSLLIEALAARSKTLGTEPSFPAQLAAGLASAIDVCELSVAQRALLRGKREIIFGALAQIKHRLTIEQSSFISIGFEKWRMASSLYKHLFSKGFLCELIPSPSKLSASAFIRVVPSHWHSEQTVSDFISSVEMFFSKVK